MKFRKKPVVLEAVRWLGTNKAEMLALGVSESSFVGGSKNLLVIDTLEGEMRADAGDWIIKGIKGEIYPCKPDIFEVLYDRVDP